MSDEQQQQPQQRTRSGRTVVRTLQFWKGEAVQRARDGTIVGVHAAAATPAKAPRKPASSRSRAAKTKQQPSQQQQQKGDSKKRPQPRAKNASDQPPRQRVRRSKDEAAGETIGARTGTLAHKRAVRCMLRQLDEQAAHTDALQDDQDIRQLPSEEEQPPEVSDEEDECDDDSSGTLSSSSSSSSSSSAASSSSSCSSRSGSEASSRAGEEKDGSDDESDDDDDDELRPARASLVALQHKNRDDFDGYISRTKQITRGRYALANRRTSSSAGSGAQQNTLLAKTAASALEMGEALRAYTAKHRKHHPSGYDEGDDDEDEEEREEKLEEDVYGRDPADTDETTDNTDEEN